MIRYVKGDVTKATEDIIAHGVNCRGVMGSGVALAIANKWPQVKTSYIHAHQASGTKLGEVQFVDIGKKTIANCATQNNYLPRGVCHANYGAIEKCMETLYQQAVHCNLTVAMPRIGAGLAGGNWKVIEEIINRVFHDREVVVYEI